MSATSVQVITIVFPNPEVNSSISYDYLPSSNVRTLSTNSANPGTAVVGLLYVPDLDPDDPCVNASAPYVPANVTRQGNLPAANFELVAIAPWLSPTCTQNYLKSARGDLISGFMFFLPDNSTTIPDPDSDTWDLGDGGNWKKQNAYPVYAIPGAGGSQLMTASAQYSGNMTDAPDGHNLTELYDSRDYVRLFAEIDTSGNGALPSLWVFLLVVLAILLAVIGSTSLLMHWLQRRRRSELRRRVANGDVDLEALGIKRLTVPKEILDEMPLYTYGSGAPVPPKAVGEAPSTAVADKLETTSPSSSPKPTTAARRTTPVASAYHPTPQDQPTCAICLDDFVAASTSAAHSSAAGSEGTIVRELPCQHIFHPECVDTFLRDSSSLCPMCKKTALPRGYCPRVVTNAMVRRERMLRRLRPQEELPAELPADGENARAGRRVGRTLSSFSLMRQGQSRRISSAPEQGQQMTELAASSAVDHAASDQGAPSAPVQPPSNPGRREWARRRAEAMLGQQPAPVDPDAEEAQRTPRWRKTLRDVFPGMRA